MSDSCGLRKRNVSEGFQHLASMSDSDFEAEFRKFLARNNKSNISSSPSSQSVSPQSSSVAQPHQAVAQNADLVNLFGEKGGLRESGVFVECVCVCVSGCV